MRQIFWIQLLFGICVVGWVGVVLPTIPYANAMLDVVLTPAELQDDAKRVATLELLQRLQRANGGSTFGIVTGAFLVLTSGIGLRLSAVNTPIGTSS